LRFHGAFFTAFIALALAVPFAVCANPPAASPQEGANPTEASAALPSMSSVQGLLIQEVRFPDLPPKEQDRLRTLVPIKAGTSLNRDAVRQSMQVIYATRRFADISARVERLGAGGVALAFVTSPNYFVGGVEVEGNPNRPNANQIANASKLQLGELFTTAKLDRAVQNIKQIMQENGFYRSKVTVDRKQDPESQQVFLTFVIHSGDQAEVGVISITGKTDYSVGQVEDIAKMHPGDLVAVVRVSNALDRLRKKYVKQDRLLAQVSIAKRTYRPDKNKVDFTFAFEPGPKVQILTEGYKIGRSALKRNVPVYEENAVDDDLLNEGRRNLLNYMQAEGYFEAKVGIIKRESNGNEEFHIIYVIDPGARHKLVRIQMSGNNYFSEELLRSRMQVQSAGRLFSHGRYNQALLSQDVRGLEDLYRANGFQQVKITSNVIDNYQGAQNSLAVDLKIDEGVQNLVGALRIVGNSKVTRDQFPALNTEVGQPFSQTNISQDRDILLKFYFNRGFPNAAFEASAKPSPDQPDRVDVTFTLREGEEFFVDQVLVSGMQHTQPFVVDREVQVKAGDPLSQIDLLKTQQNLYDLGIFSQVDTAVQNPDGEEPQKDVLVRVQEAKRYTFQYGLGLEFQTGQPAVGTNQPQGQTGVSPRVSFDVTRLNFRGRDHTVTFKSHVGRLQQRALISYDAPAWFNSKNWRLTITSFYDNTLDVTTFTSQRLEGSVQAEQTIGRGSIMDYRFTYRKVKASNIEISPDQVPLLSRPVRVGIPGFSYIRDKRDNPLESTRGSYNTIDGGVASSYFGSEADFSRLLIQNSTYHQVGKNRPSNRKFVIARSTRVGLETVFGNTLILPPGQPCPTQGVTTCETPTVIPLPERFFMGGGNSHRGFGLNQAGPRDPTTGFPLGGAALFLNNVELRLPPMTLPFFQDNLSFALFHDAGNVFTSNTDMLHSLAHWRQPTPQLCNAAATRAACSYNYISQVIGVGLRYKTPIGPVRFDFGYNLNPPAFPSCQTAPNSRNPLPTSSCPSSSPYFLPQQLSRFNVFFSIGQTF
jgi:outer membrane protein insertion porin family